ncbi:hypothetical protein SQ03_11595, partial [Methylobacterium platani JCM 14648]
MAETWIEAALNGPWGRERQPGIPITVDEVIGLIQELQVQWLARRLNDEADRPDAGAGGLVDLTAGDRGGGEAHRPPAVAPRDPPVPLR